MAGTGGGDMDAEELAEEVLASGLFALKIGVDGFKCAA